MRSRKRAFTILEMLTVLGIMLILFGMLYAGISYISASLRSKSTITRLAVLRNMTTEWELSYTVPTSYTPTSVVIDAAKTRMTVLLPSGWTAAQSLPINPLTVQSYDWIGAADPTSVCVGAPCNDVSRNFLSTQPLGDRNTFWVVRTTSVAMAPILSNPLNRTLLNQMPAKRQLVVPAVDVAGAMTYVRGDHVGKPATVSGQSVTLSYACKPASGSVTAATIPTGATWAQEDDNAVPLLLDAWGNPIIWVPPAGLYIYDVTVTTVAGYQVASPDYTKAPLRVVKSPDGKGFWASAGADGRFQGGPTDTTLTVADRQEAILKGANDNLYSFEN